MENRGRKGQRGRGAEGGSFTGVCLFRNRHDTRKLKQGDECIPVGQPTPHLNKSWHSFDDSVILTQHMNHPQSILHADASPAELRVVQAAVLEGQAGPGLYGAVEALIKGDLSAAERTAGVEVDRHGLSRSPLLPAAAAAADVHG